MITKSWWVKLANFLENTPGWKWRLTALYVVVPLEFKALGANLIYFKLILQKSLGSHGAKLWARERDKSCSTSRANTACLRKWNINSLNCRRESGTHWPVHNSILLSGSRTKLCSTSCDEIKNLNYFSQLSGEILSHKYTFIVVRKYKFHMES